MLDFCYAVEITFIKAYLKTLLSRLMQISDDFPKFLLKHRVLCLPAKVSHFRYRVFFYSF